MTTHPGFGKPKAQPKVSKRAAKRTEAAKQYDQMTAGGALDYEVYIRIQGKKGWYPVGVVAVKRSSQINQAIFGSQEELLQGAVRLYPILRKHQQQLEYGYRLKASKDEPIQLAVPTQAGGQAGLQNIITQVKDRVTSLLKRN